MLSASSMNSVVDSFASVEARTIETSSGERGSALGPRGTYVGLPAGGLSVVGCGRPLLLLVVVIVVVVLLINFHPKLIYLVLVDVA